MYTIIIIALIGILIASFIAIKKHDHMIFVFGLILTSMAMLIASLVIVFISEFYKNNYKVEITTLYLTPKHCFTSIDGVLYVDVEKINSDSTTTPILISTKNVSIKYSNKESKIIKYEHIYEMKGKNRFLFSNTPEDYCELILKKQHE